jgi:hypothetical protein
MLNQVRWVLIVAVLCGGLCGCQSGPRWDWWRLGRSGSPDSSPIARAAGPPLPSELAQQGDAALASGTVPAPAGDSAANVPAFGGDAPAFSPSDTALAANSYHTASNGYPATNPAIAASQIAGNYPSTAAADPFANGSASAATAGAVVPSAPVQNGLYDPDGYSAAPQTSPPASTQVDRYGPRTPPYSTAGMPTAGTPTGESTYSSTAAPWSSQSAPTTGNENVAAAGYEQYGSTSPGYSAANPPRAAGGVMHGNGVSAGNSTMAGSSQTRYGTGAAVPALQVAQVDEGTAPTTPQENMVQPYSASSTTAISSPPHYRPGGTSDYTGQGDLPPVSVASGPPHSTSSQGTLPGATPSGNNSYSPTQPAYGEVGTGRRY